MLVDPDDLSFTVGPLQAQVASARLTIEQTAQGLRHLYHVSATDSVRFLITDRDFIIDDGWTAAYLLPGATAASSQVFFTDHIVFFDNAIPGARRPISLFVQPLTEPRRRLEPHRAFQRGKPGFKFLAISVCESYGCRL